MGEHKLNLIKLPYAKKIKPIKEIFCSKCNINRLKIIKGYYFTSVTGTCSPCLETIRQKRLEEQKITDGR